jgi:hypothetical protein
VGGGPGVVIVERDKLCLGNTHRKDDKRGTAKQSNFYPHTLKAPETFGTIAGAGTGFIQSPDCIEECKPQTRSELIEWPKPEE